MSLELIWGPPNSGRTGLVLERFERSLGADPLLVLPTRDDVDRFERELCGRRGGLLGGSVVNFPQLFGEVARACGAPGGVRLSRMQRVWIARAAAGRAELRALARSARREGFAPALEALLAELQAAGLSAADAAAAVDAAEDPGAYEREVVELFAGYESLRDRLGQVDEHLIAERAATALRADPGAWRERPVLLYGFDDLAREQIELIAALAAAAPVTVAFSYEDRAAMSARAELIGVLRDELGGEVAAVREPDPMHTSGRTLFHLERNLFEPRAPSCECDDSVRLLEAAGERGEAELIGRRVARLIADGADPDEIAIAVRSPDRQAPLLSRVLAGLGIPVAAEARIPLASTATGTTLLRLLAIAGGSGTAEQVVAFLRGPARANPRSVDWLERRVRRGRMATAAEALESWRGGEERDRRIFALDDLAEAERPEDAARAVARLAADIAERPHLRLGELPSSGPAVELRAAAEVDRALEETMALGALAPRPEELAELLSHVRVPLWRGPTEGRVRILSPYRLRATRVSHLFVAGLVDGAFPGPGAIEPLLSDERRVKLGLPARRDPAAEERYLFYACVSRPERSLELSYPATDESGGATARSPFVDEVRALLSPAPTPDPADDPLEAEIAVRRGLADVAPDPEDASSERDLARALAALGPEACEIRAAGLEIGDELRTTTLAAVGAAREAAARAAAPGPLSAAPVLEKLGAQDLFGASTLEEYDLCPYRWFVGHELRPRPIDPDPEPLENGGIVHAALEQLYRDPPVEGRRPTEETLERWQQAAHALVREIALEREWDLEGGRARIVLLRLDAVLDRFLARDARDGGPLVPDPDLLEAAFGASEHDQFPPADLGSFRLHGRIDRIDVSGDRKALIRDYKLSAKVVAASKLLDEGKLQLPLYMAAVQGMGLEPIGGLYQPLGAARDDRPRGLLRAEEKDVLIPGGTESAVRTDFLDDEAFDGLVAAARERSEEIVAGIRAGRVLREPRGGECPRWCGYASICRMERGAIEPDPDDEELG